MENIEIDKELIAKEYRTYKEWGENFFDKNYKKHIEEINMFSPKQIQFIKDVFSQGFASGFVLGANKN